MSTLTTRLLPALAAASVLVLAGCSAGTSEAAAPATSAPAPQQELPREPGGGGASGEIASVTGTVMQVRSADAQTAVTWTDETTFTATVAGTLADVTVGSCVVAVSATSTDSGSDEVAATSIQLTDAADDGTCAGGLGGFGGFGGGPGGGDRPDGAPTDLPEMPEMPEGAMPSGAPDGMQMPSIAAGPVTAIDGSTFTVESTGPDGTSTTSTVTVTDATTYTTTVTADATAVVAGQCATARGDSDDSGKVTATTITVSAPTDGECTTGMPGGRGFPGGGPQGSTQDDGSDA